MTMQVEEKEYVPYNPDLEKDPDEEEPREIFPPGAAPMMFSVSTDKTLRTWNLKKGLCERVLNGHQGAVMCMAVDWEGGKEKKRDAKRLVLTGSADFTIMKWETIRNLWVSTFEGHEGTVSKIIPDWPSRRFISSSYDRTVKLWDLDEETCLTTLKGHHSGPVCGIDIDWASGCVVTASEDTDLRQWDMEVGESVLSLEGHTGPVWAVSMDPESMRLLSASSDRTLKLWDLRSGQMISSMLRHTLPVGVLDVDWPSGRAMSGSSDRSIILWDFENCEELAKMEKHFGGVWSLSVDWKGQRMVSGAGPCDNGIRVWDFDLEHGPPYCHENLQEHQETVWALDVDWSVCFWEAPVVEDSDDDGEKRVGDDDDGEGKNNSGIEKLAACLDPLGAM